MGYIISLIMGVCFFRISYHAVLLGRPVPLTRLRFSSIILDGYYCLSQPGVQGIPAVTSLKYNLHSSMSISMLGIEFLQLCSFRPCLKHSPLSPRINDSPPIYGIIFDIKMETLEHDNHFKVWPTKPGKDIILFCLFCVSVLQ